MQNDKQYSIVKNINSNLGIYRRTQRKSAILSYPDRSIDLPSNKFDRFVKYIPRCVEKYPNQSCQKEGQDTVKRPLNCSYIERSNIFPRRTGYEDKNRRETETKKSDNDDKNTDKKYKIPIGFIVNSSQMPKLRQTGSTLCQSPKSNILFPKPSKITQFKKITSIGKGKFGQVYLVMHRITGFIAALKVIQKQDLRNGTSQQNDKALQQLISQIKIQLSLEHPNLIKLYDFFSDENNVYLLLELACDGPLFDFLEKKHTLSQETTSIVVREIVSGIDYMHKRSFIHRDIKLQNIVLSHGMAKICDFGWSVHCPKEFRSTLCGTPLYLSPEALMGMQYNKKIDSWAIGALTHQLTTGENPFNITKKQELSKIVTDDFEMNQGSPELRSFITFILRKNPSTRPDTATILKHPFLQKYKDLETSEQLFEHLGRSVPR